MNTSKFLKHQAVRASWFLAPKCSSLQGLDIASYLKSAFGKSWHLPAQAWSEHKHLGTSDSTKVLARFEGGYPKDLLSSTLSLFYVLCKDACEIGSRTLDS